MCRTTRGSSQFSAVSLFVQELTFRTWNGWIRDNRGYKVYDGLISLSLAYYPILKSFSIECGNLQESYYEWGNFESLSIHNMHYLETISIGAKTIPNTKYLSLLSKKHCMFILFRFTQTTNS